MHCRRLVGLTLVATLLLVGCAPVKKLVKRTEWSPYDASEVRQEKEGVIFEYKEVTELPPTFFAQAQACDRTLVPLYGGSKPVMEKVCFARPGQFWSQFALTNQTGHVLRLNQTILRLFDPAGNEYEAMTRDDLIADFLSQRPCPTSPTVVPQFKLIKLFDRNTEILPNTTATGWVAFQPASVAMPGTWKLTLYEVPVLADEAGKVTKTTHFEFRDVCRKFEETWEGSTLLERRELTD